MRTPKIVTRLIEADGFYESEAELKRDVRQQRRWYNEIAIKATDFPGWLAFKLTITPKQAEQIIAWTRPQRKKQA